MANRCWTLQDCTTELLIEATKLMVDFKSVLQTHIFWSDPDGLKYKGLYEIYYT